MTEEKAVKTVRLNKFLAERLGISRREADELIKAGEVTLNGETAVIGNRVTQGDKVVYRGETLPDTVDYVYYIFHKPYGYVCSRNKQGKDPTIYELLPDDMQNLKNVGRLDRTTSGVMLLTNDGDLGFQLTHPKFVKQKVYEVTLHKPLDSADRKKITEDGVEIVDGLSKFEIADNLHPSSDDTPLKQRRAQKQEATKPDAPDGFHLIVTLTEGRNRQIRRTFAALGYNILTLHRIKFGKYDLGDLKPGEYRKIEQ